MDLDLGTVACNRNVAFHRSRMLNFIYSIRDWGIKEFGSSRINVLNDWIIGHFFDPVMSPEK